MTAAEVLDRYLTRLRQGGEGRAIHPEIAKISGLAPSEVDARALDHEHLLEKHR